MHPSLVPAQEAQPEHCPQTPRGEAKTAGALLDAMRQHLTLEEALADSARWKDRSSEVS